MWAVFSRCASVQHDLLAKGNDESDGTTFDRFC